MIRWIACKAGHEEIEDKEHFHHPRIEMLLLDLRLDLRSGTWKFQPGISFS